MTLYRFCVLWLLLLLNFFNFAFCTFFPYVYPRIKLEAKLQSDAGDPLILTPYLEKGNVDLARNMSRVTLTEKIGFVSHAGFFTVNAKYNSNLYFWYFPPFNKNIAAPVILWLQGGPGGSSLYGLFAENGPLIAKKDGFALRKYHWALDNHLIFVDNPAGTGFSFTDDEQGYCTDEQCIAKGLYDFLQQFYTLFPYLRNNKFFITGESYAGKYIPSLGIEIHNRNRQEKYKINLKGLAFGNAYCDPINQLGYGNYLHQHGLIDDNQKTLFNKLQNDISNEIKKKNWVQAGLLMATLMDGDPSNYSYFSNYTGFTSYFNFLNTKDDPETSTFDLLKNDKVRRSVHVGGLPFNSGTEVQSHLANDILQTVAPEVSELLSYYRLMFYNGQLDIIVAYPLTENFLRNLNFSSAEEYRTAKRNIWRVGDEIAGYVKKAGNLTEVLVRNAGHMVPQDQPKWTLDLITRFIKNKL